MDSEYYREKEYLNEPELPSDTTPTIKKFRDHSDECEHGYTNEHITKDLPEGYNPDEYTGKWWSCPGGRERTFEKWGSVYGQPDKKLWVEVSDD